jgi:hypothetical protein
MSAHQRPCAALLYTNTHFTNATVGISLGTRTHGKCDSQFSGRAGGGTLLGRIWQIKRQECSATVETALQLLDTYTALLPADQLIFISSPVTRKTAAGSLGLRPGSFSPSVQYTYTCRQHAVRPTAFRPIHTHACHPHSPLDVAAAAAAAAALFFSTALLFGDLGRHSPILLYS